MKDIKVGDYVKILPSFVDTIDGAPETIEQRRSLIGHLGKILFASGTPTDLDMYVGFIFQIIGDNHHFGRWFSPNDLEMVSRPDCLDPGETWEALGI